MATQQSQDPRRLLVLFVVATLVPAASLVWLGWRMVQQDRTLEGQHLEEQRNQAADLAAASLERVLAEADDTLTTFSTARLPVPIDLEYGGALIQFGRTGVVERGGELLPYYPGSAAIASPVPAPLVAADELELHKNDLTGALQILRGLSASGDAVVRGEALLRIARIERKRGDLTQALGAFQKLGDLGDTPISGLPAGFEARQGRALILASQGRRAELRSEAASLCSELERGRWLLGRTEFEFAYHQATTWLGQPERTVSSDQLAMADAAEALWREWQAGEQPASQRGRHIFRFEEQSVLALSRSSSDRLSALLIGPRFLQSEWLQKLPTVGGEHPVEFALTDADGQPVLGHPDVPLTLQSIRPASATQLPWTLHAITSTRGARPPGLSGRTRLLLAGISMMAIMLIAGGLFIHRAISRDIMVAQLQSDFVAAVSHEFRTPLTTLRQLSEMLVRGRVSSEERRQRFYETLLHESERLQRLIEALLNFGAMESGKLQYRFEPVKPNAFLHEVVSDFEHEVSALGYHVELHENGTLPAIRADRESLARVFWNLLDNAVKYSPESRTVWVDMSNGGKRVIVRVRDQGLGIPAAEQKDIFRKFVRGAASKHASIRGTGIGLAVAQQIVAAHGGDILVESEPGQGSVFTVLLPAMEA